MLRPVARALIALALGAGALSAQVVTIPYTILQTIPGGSISYTYTGLDASGTTMNAAATGGGIMNPLSGTWPGLWFGSNQSSATYKFTFNKPITFFELYITAQSTISNHAETFTNWTVNGGTASFAYTNVQFTQWDGTSITATQDDGRSILGISVGAGQSFTSVSFDHVQVGSPNGSVIEYIKYDASVARVVPEPSTYALMAAGLLAIGFVSRKQRRAA